MLERAVIMAGGEGLRLRPLTELVPKPLVPLLDEPVAGYALQLLRRHGVKRATLALRCGAEQVRAALGDERQGVRLDYSVEARPLGTAGSVRRAAGGAGGTLLVLSGDVLTDCDLSAMLRAHQTSRALATVALTAVADARPYGLCETAEDGRVTRFCEKPDGKAAVPGLVNAGVYLLEPEALAMIPADRPADFGRHVLPRLAEAGRLQGWLMRGYWMDVGCPVRYAAAQTDLLMGRVGLAVKGKRSGLAILAPGARVDAAARITGRCYVGEGAVIASGAVVGQGTVLCRGAWVGGGAHVAQSCLWEGVRLSGGAIVRQAILLPDGRALPYPGRAHDQKPDIAIQKEG